MKPKKPAPEKPSRKLSNSAPPDASQAKTGDLANSPSGRKKLAKQLLAWFAQSARDLPWRKNKDLYRIWVSEIMLQQTQVVTVIDYFQRFLKRFPTVADLANAPESDVLKMWEGLGYYRRARQLHAAAKKIVSDHGGKFPRDFSSVRALPGIGRYTAGAILSIGLGQRLPILEANTIRVFSRLTAYQGATETTAGQKYLWQVAEELLPAEEIGAFNQALMELGSEICKPRSSLCETCPVSNLCPTFQHGWQEIIPAPKKKTAYEDLHQAAIVIWHQGKVLVRKCGVKERFAGLWDFPRFDQLTEPAEKKEQADHMVAQVKLQTGQTLSSVLPIFTLRHGVTRFRITLDVFESQLPAKGKSKAASGIADYSETKLGQAEMLWIAPADLSHIPLSVTGRHIAAKITAG